MEKEVSSFEYDLRNLACDGEICEVLQKLHEERGGQWVYSVNQDYEVYPDVPELSEAFFYPEVWKRYPTHPAFPGVKEFSWEGKDGKRVHFIHSSLSIGAEVRHILQIKEGIFTEEDYQVIDYASILVGYLRPLPATPRGINRYMTQSYNGICPEHAPKGIFPEEGFAIVVMERGDKGTLKQQGYLGYRLHRSFRKNLRYCFLNETHLLLFVGAHNIPEVTARLEEIVGTGDGDIIMGISDKYPFEEMHYAMSEARHAVEVGNLMEGENHIFFHAELGIFRILEYPQKDSPVNRMMEQMTEKMMTYSKEKRDALSETMRCFVENHYNYQKTADAMYAHVNTIRYRINLLETIWGCNLQKEQDRLLFEVVNQLLPLWIKESGYGKEL